MSKTLIFTATYNEVENIAKFLNEVSELNDQIDILIIDDNSPDGTGETLLKLEKKINNLKIIIREKKLGLDTAHKLAFNYAKKNGYKKFVTLDADLSHDPKEIPNMINLLDKNDFVIGSRYMIGGKCEMSWSRKFLSITGNKIIKNFFNIKCNEFTTSFRGFNLEKLTNFSFDEIKSMGYSFFMETIFRLNKKNYKIVEIPIHFKDRTKGKSKIPKLEILRTLKNLFLLKFVEND